jgi:molecular chaperone DnaK (HSP70)
MNTTDEEAVEFTRQQLMAMMKTTVDIIADYLRFLWKHILERLRVRLTAPVLDNMILKIVLTIPAIWDHKAQENMLKAAAKAGLLDERPCGKTEISLIAEPAAAALATYFDAGISLNPTVKVRATYSMGIRMLMISRQATLLSFAMQVVELS